MLRAIIYLENSYKPSFYYLKRRVDSGYILNKVEYPRTSTTVQSLILNYQPNYNSNRQYQSQGVSNQLMFSQCGKTGDNDGENKIKFKDILTISSEMIVEKEVTMRETVNTIHRKTQRGCIIIH